MLIKTNLNVNTQLMQLTDGTPLGGNLNQYPSLTLGQKDVYFNIQLVTDTLSTKYTDVATGYTSSLRIALSNTNNNALVEMGNTNWDNTTGSEYAKVVSTGAPDSVTFDGTTATLGIQGSLTAGQYVYNTTTGQLFVRLADSTNPETKAEDFILIEYTNTAIVTPLAISAASDVFNLTNSWYDTVTSTWRTPVITNGELSWKLNANTAQFFANVSGKDSVQAVGQVQFFAPSTGIFDYMYKISKFILNNRLVDEDDELELATGNYYEKSESDAKYVTKALTSVSGNLIQFDVNGNAADSTYASTALTRLPTTNEKAAMTASNTPSGSNAFATMTDVNNLLGDLRYQGTWNAFTNTPDITATTQSGYYWKVSVEGTTTLGPYSSWNVGDWAVKIPSSWDKVDNTDSYTVKADIDDITPGYLADKVDALTMEISATDKLQVKDAGLTVAKFATSALSTGTADNDKIVTLGKLNDVAELKQSGFGGIDKTTPINRSIDYTTRVLTISAATGTDFTFFIGDGVTYKYDRTAPVAFPAFTDTVGIWNFYFDINGNPVTTQTTPTNYCDIAMVYRILWNPALSGSAKAVAESIEWHKNVISCEDHNQWHTFGTLYRFGGDAVHTAITTGLPNVSGVNTCFGLNTITNSDDCLDYTITNSTGGLDFQQDMGVTVAANITTANAGLFEVRYDVAGAQYVLPATRFPFAWDVTTNRPEYFTSAGVRTLVPDDNYFIYFMYVLQDPRNGKAVRIISIPATYTSLASAQAIGWDTIQATYPTLRDKEIRPLYRMIFHAKNAVPTPYDVAVKYTVLREVQDIRVQRVTATTAAGAVTASGVSVAFTPTNYTAGAQTVEAHLVGINTALGSTAGRLVWEIITSNTTAVNGKGYFIDATSNTVTLTLPSTPSLNNQIGYYVVNKTNVVTIARGGSNIDGVAADLTPAVKDAKIFSYSNATIGWATIAANGSGSSSGGGLAWSVITTNTTAVKSNGYLVDAASNIITITLPASPTVGDEVGIRAINSTNIITLARNSLKIEGNSEDYTVTSRTGFSIVYSGSTYGWVIVTEIDGQTPITPTTDVDYTSDQNIIVIRMFN